MVKQIGKSYQSDLSGKDWQIIELHIPKQKTKQGRKREHSLREIINAIFYVCIRLHVTSAAPVLSSLLLLKV